jgi:hypothetical protein
MMRLISTTLIKHIKVGIVARTNSTIALPRRVFLTIT